MAPACTSARPDDGRALAMIHVSVWLARPRGDRRVLHGRVPRRHRLDRTL